ncbi:cAMP-binding protein - catabolite gene activator and regulatory subunit of cAMP-dependent protein kinase [Leptolyngbya sp. NIES-2104]|nr:cAMP-binding protein - catabolite gene activator and regulatory subunit of cAMP-dependent protein kinase [Leptolyngbya sp. NIES-2104]
MGIQRQRTVVDPTSGASRQEVVRIDEDSWLGRNHLYVQFGLFVLGLAARLLLVNGDRIALGIFLLATIACAILVGYLYSGKSWCHYFCPMSPVQTVYTGPRSLLGSQAHQSRPGELTQSTCRTIDSQTQQEQSACVACKSPCFDIDAENTYWKELKKPGRRLAHYGYLGMVIAFYLYFFLYSGNWDYYFTGAWAHEEDVLYKVADIGFYLFDTAIPIPKWIAVFLTFAVFISTFVFLGSWLEKQYRSYQTRRGQKVSAEQAQHIIFTVFTLASFWIFFSYGARPSLNRLPSFLVLAINALIVLVGTLWVVRTLRRSKVRYEREKVSLSLRQQLQQVEIPSEVLAGRALDNLSVDEVYTLAKTLPNWSQESRLKAYTDILADITAHHEVRIEESCDFLSPLRQTLQLTDSDHFDAIQFLAEHQSGPFDPDTRSANDRHVAPTIAFSRRTARTMPYRSNPPR